MEDDEIPTYDYDPAYFGIRSLLGIDLALDDYNNSSTYHYCGKHWFVRMNEHANQIMYASWDIPSFVLVKSFLKLTARIFFSIYDNILRFF